MTETGHDNVTWRDDLTLLLNAAEEAGRAAMSYFRQSPEVWWKNEGRSPVSAADFAANDILNDMLRGARPDYGWLSEETEDDGSRRGHETLFVVDPIDGTRAFVAGKPVWCVSAAVVHKNRPVAGVLVAPALGEVFSACAGGMAEKNGKSLTIKNAGSGDRVIAAAHEVFEHLPEDFRAHAVRSEHVPSLAYRLAMVADGRLNGTLVKPNSHDWDIAAAELILELAGGVLCDLQGNVPGYNRERVSHDMLVAAPVSEIQQLLEAVHKAENH